MRRREKRARVGAGVEKDIREVKVGNAEEAEARVGNEEEAEAETENKRKARNPLEDVIALVLSITVMTPSALTTLLC